LIGTSEYYIIHYITADRFASRFYIAYYNWNDRSMGRPREFDIEQALLIATKLFWSKGYDGTSVSDLTQAMQIAPPSFYFAFESKEALFLRVVDDYRREQAKIVEGALGEQTTKDVIRKLLEGFAAFFCNADRVRGCLIMNSALPVGEGPAFRQRFAEERRALQRQLRNSFRRLRDIPRGTDVDGLARMIVTLIWGLAVEAQSGASRSDLDRMTASLLALFPADEKV
jgi:AcrR family transcriptional regulator